MAQHAVKTRKTDTAGGDSSEAVPVSRPRVGRPAKLKVWDYSRSKLAIQKSADFLDYVAGYPDKTGLMGYLFRLRPRIDHSLIGITETSIQQISDVALMNEEYIGSQWGRGHYMLKLSDANRPRGQQECCRTWFELDHVEKPPQYDPRTLCLGESKNVDEITRQINAGVMMRDERGNPRLRTEADGAPPPISPLPRPAAAGGGDELIGKEMVGQIILKAMDRAMDRGTQSPHDAVKDSIEIAKLMHPPVQINEADLVERIVARLKPADAPTDMFSAYERVQGFIDRFVKPVTGTVLTDGQTNAAGAAPASSWASYVPSILAEARGALPEVMAALRELRAMNGGPAAATMNGNGAHQAVQQQQQPVNTMTIEQRIEEIALLGFGRMREGVKGFDFAAYICNFHPGGLEVFERLFPAGVVGVISLAAMNPRTRPIVNDPAQRAQLEAFLMDFFSYDPAGGEDEPPAAGAGASTPAH